MASNIKPKKNKDALEGHTVVCSGKWKLLGVRLKTKDMEKVEKAAVEAGVTVSRWASAAVLTALDPPLTIHDIPLPTFYEPPEAITCQKCGHTRQVCRKVQFNAPSLPGDDPGCPKCAASAPQKPIDVAYKEMDRIRNVINEIPSPATMSYVESPIILPAPEKFQFSKIQNPDSWDGAKCPKCGGPFREPEEMLSHKCKRVKPQVQQPNWTEEFAKMDTMEADEAMGRFRDLVDGRKIPKGFARLKRSEQIEILEKEMPL